MNIKGKIVTLRAVEKKDLQLLCDMLNDPEIEDLVVGWSFPISIDQQEKWFEKAIDDKKNLRFIIEAQEMGAVGIATLHDIDWKNRSAGHGIKLCNPKVRGKGIGTDTVMAVMRYAFDELNLNRLEGSWFEDNIASSNLYTKCGWRIEGCKKQYIFKKGEYRDLMITAILAEEYRQLIIEKNYWES